jgi:hypothetical protein
LVKRELGKYLIRSFISVLIILVFFCGIGFLYEREFFYALDRWKFLPGQENEAIKGSIDLYNKIYTDLYTSNGVPLRLDDFPASKQLKHELFQNLGYLRSNELVLVFDMASLVVKEIKRPSSAIAEVTVFEEWNYVFQNTQTRATARSIKGMGQGYKYILRKFNGEWLVIDYFPADVTTEKKNEFYF